MTSTYAIKVILSLISLSLWVGSLFLPVAEEIGAGRGHLMSGSWVLFWTFSYGLLFLVGIPWAVLNVGLLVLLYFNLRGRRHEWLAVSFIFLSSLVTLLTAGLAFSGVLWRYGLWFWLGSMFLMGFASYIDYGQPSSRRRRPRAT